MPRLRQDNGLAQRVAGASGLHGLIIHDLAPTGLQQQDWLSNLGEGLPEIHAVHRCLVGHIEVLWLFNGTQQTVVNAQVISHFSVVAKKRGAFVTVPRPVMSPKMPAQGSRQATSFSTTLAIPAGCWAATDMARMPPMLVPTR